MNGTRLIRAFEADQAEALKQEIEYDLEDMEENQDLLLYFSLMEFRHRIMLDKLMPVKDSDTKPPFSDMLNEIESNQQKLTGLLEYYFYYFRGMYEFKQKNFILAIDHYKHAEERPSMSRMRSKKLSFFLKSQKCIITLNKRIFP